MVELDDVLAVVLVCSTARLVGASWVDLLVLPARARQCHCAQFLEWDGP